MTNFRRDADMGSHKLFVWASWIAALVLLNITSAWLLAELTLSPVVNSLLVGARNLPALLSITPSIGGVYIFVCAAIILELAVVFFSFQLLPAWILIVLVLLAAFVAALGFMLSQQSMTGMVLSGGNISNPLLQRSGDIGGFSGTLIGGFVYPYLKLFPPLLLLIVPPLLMSRRGLKAVLKEVSDRSNPTKMVPPLDRWCLFQGACDGALFGLLPLWVLTLKQGMPVDFSLIVGAFLLGRVFENRLLPKLSATAFYILCAVLVFVAFYPNVPIWLDVIIFVPLGASHSRIEFDLVDYLDAHGELPLRRDILWRSSAVGAFVGSLMLGMIGQGIGISNAMFLVSIFYAFGALITWRWRRHPKMLAG